MSHGYKIYSMGKVVNNYVTYFSDIIRFIYCGDHFEINRNT